MIINTYNYNKTELAVQRKFKRLKTVQLSGKENIDLESIPIKFGYFKKYKYTRSIRNLIFC